MDPLSTVIALLRPHAALSKPITARGDWGVRYAAYGMPGFAMVVEGGCWLTLAAGDPVRLEAGDFVLLPVAPAFDMASRPGMACVPVEPSGQALRHGDPDGAPDFRMLGGSFRVDPANAALVSALLPGMIHVRSALHDTTGLSRVLGLILEETAGDRPGAGMILERLLEVMLIAALRHHGIDGGSRATGLLGGMRDPGVAKALQALHANVGDRWTVARLAGIACMSRSAFAARFTQTVGCAPIEYLARWRMALAKDALSRGGISLDRLAEEIGYESASAFSTAFRRHAGCPPGGFARSRRSARGRPAAALIPS